MAQEDPEVELKPIPIEPSGYLDQLFRQTRIHHMQLSSMADVKANMMLTLASLIITFSIGYLSDPFLRWPVVVMISFCIITILAAAYAVMPKIDWQRRPNLDDPNCNILFFGTFLNLDYDEYIGMMNQIIHDPTRVYEAQMREIYDLGLYLGHKKYRYIRLAYQSFLAGLITSTIVFVITELIKMTQI